MDNEQTNKIYGEFQYSCERFKKERENNPNPDDIVCAKWLGRIMGLKYSLEILGMHNLSDELPWDQGGVNYGYTVPVVLK